MDATKARALSDKFDIRGYPTLKHFLLGGTVVKDFQGARSKEGIIAAVSAVQNKDELWAELWTCWSNRKNNKYNFNNKFNNNNNNDNNDTEDNYQLYGMACS